MDISLPNSSQPKNQDQIHSKMQDLFELLVENNMNEDLLIASNEQIEKINKCFGRLIARKLNK